MRGIVLSILLCLAGLAFSQDPVISLNIVVRDDDSGKKLDGATVVVKVGGTVFVTKTSTSGGKVPPIDLPLGQNYTVFIQKEGYVTKVATIDGHYDYPEDLPPFIPFPIQTSLFQDVEGVDFNWLETTPMIKFELDQYGNQTWDQKYTNDMLKKIEELKDQIAKKKEEEAAKKEKFDALVAEGDKAVGKSDYATAVSKYEEALTLFDDAAVKKKLDEAKKAMEEASKAAETDQKYNEKIEAAKKAYDAKDYKTALDLYKEAATIKPAEQEPKTKIPEIEKLLADQKAQKEKFDKLVADGDASVGKEEYDNAISNYEQALQIFDEPAVKTKLENAKKAKADKDAADQAAKEKEEQYNMLIAEADKLFDAGSYEDSKKKYQEALTVKPNQPHPTGQITKIEELLKKQQQEAENQQKYDEAIKAADASFDAKDWDKAISSYKEASNIKPDEKYPKDRLALAEENKNKDSAEKELNEKYNKLLADGKELMNGENYTAAIAKFKEASALKSTEQEPKDLIAECEKKAKEKADGDAKEAEYNKLMTEGKDAQAKTDLNAALSKYEAALVVKPGDTEAQKKIDEVKKLIADKDAAEEQETKFNELVEKGDKAFDSKSYEDARSNYTEALKVKDDQGVKDKIAQIDEILKKQTEDAEKQQKYDDAIKAADALMKTDDWKKAIDKYNEALTYKDDQYPKDQINTAKNKLQEQTETEEKEKKFADLVAQGDELASNEKFADAIKKYEEAFAIKPDPELTKKIQSMKDKEKEAEQNAQKDADYKTALDKADGLRDAEKYEEAIAAYENALKIKAGESYPQEQINKCNEILKQREEEQANKEAFDKKYNDIIIAADKAFDGRNFEEALKKYEEALTMKPNEAHPKEREEEIKKIMAELDAAQKEQERYDQAIKTADQLFDAANFNEAKSAYQEALNIKPGEKYPDDRIKLCEEKIKELTNNQAEQEYQKLLSDAKEKLDAKDYQEAITIYTKAKGLRPADPFPQNQIDLINKLMNDMQAQNEVDTKYDAAIKKADDLFSSTNYLEAKKAYEDALNIKANEQYPKDRIELCNQKMQEQSQNEVEEQYQKILDVAKEKMDAQEYERALELYERAKEMKPSDPLPQKKIDEITQLLKDLDAQKSLEERYQQAIKKADDLFDTGSYKEARKAYEEALGIKSNEKYPQDQIALCNQRMQEESLNEVEEQYQKILEVAQEKMDSKDFERALELYKRAKDMKPSDPLPQKRIDEITQILKDLEAQKNLDDKYKLALEKADDLFTQGNYKDAKPAYEAALDIKSGEQYPKDQIALCNQRMQEESVNEVEEQYKRLLEAAQKKFDEKDYVKALEYYERAKGIRPDDPLPQQRIDEINQILKELEDEDAKRKKFNELVQDADILFEKTNWQEAREKYEAALELFNEKYPRDQVEKCIEKIKDKPDELDAYRKLIEKADEYFAAENWEKAQGLYKRAVGLNSKDQYPKDQLKKIQEILNPPKEIINESPELTDYGNPVNESAIDMEKMLMEAKEEAEYWEIQQIYQAREDADDALREWDKENVDNIHEAKDKTEEIREDVREDAEIANEKREGYVEDVEAWRDQIEKTNNEYVTMQTNDIHYQDRKLDNIEIEITENTFDNDKPREAYEADIEKIKQENIDFIKNEETGQENDIQTTNEAIEYINENHISSDPNNDVDRLNTIVELEDAKIVIINKNNHDTWNQEDETFKTKDEQNDMVDEINANNLESDNKRAEFEKEVEEQTTEYNEREERNANDQEDKNFGVKEETEKIREDLREDAEIANEKREGYEEDVEKTKVELTVVETENASDQVDKTYDAKEETEKIREDLREDAEIANEKREGYEEDVEKTKVEMTVVETEHASDQVDKTYDAKEETEKIREDLREDAEIANEKREGYEEDVEKTKVELTVVETEHASDQVDKTYDAKEETEKIREDLREDAEIANEKREGYEDVVEEKVEELDNENRKNANDQNDEVSGNDVAIEKMELEIQEHNSEMSADQDKNADKNKNAIDEHTDHINENIGENEEALAESENFVEELKTLNPSTVTPEIANELGKKFPEGVTETTFALNDSRGLMKAYVVRRIVVESGVGTVYEKTQTRHGSISFTRNGAPITEYQWDDETGGGKRN